MTRETKDLAELRRIILDALNQELGGAGSVTNVLIDPRHDGRWVVLASWSDAPAEALTAAEGRVIPRMQRLYRLRS